VVSSREGPHWRWREIKGVVVATSFDNQRRIWRSNALCRHCLFARGDARALEAITQIGQAPDPPIRIVD
jgi:hypothetical protein